MNNQWLGDVGRILDDVARDRGEFSLVLNGNVFSVTRIREGKEEVYAACSNEEADFWNILSRFRYLAGLEASTAKSDQQFKLEHFWNHHSPDGKAAIHVGFHSSASGSRMTVRFLEKLRNDVPKCEP